MDRVELASFLRSRRERLSPAEAGLPAGPRRRTPGLRREEVAVAAHISTEYYVRLEQARAPRPSGQVLAAIAAALDLDGAERDHLHLLAGAAPAAAAVHQRAVRPSVLALLERLPATAGFVVSAAFEVLAWNELAAALMEDFGALAPRQRNLARRAFLPADDPVDLADLAAGVDGVQEAARRARGRLYGVADTETLRRQVVAQLRRSLARYPHDPAVVGLVAELRAGSADFERRWRRHDVTVAPVLTKTFDHPAVGAVTVDCDALALEDADQHLVLYTAPVGSPSADALALLGVLGAQWADREGATQASWRTHGPQRGPLSI